MRKLLWKEWHEQSWKLGFGCIVLAALALIGLRSRIVADETMVMWVCLLGVGLLPVLASTGLLPAERAEGSFEMLLSLPVDPRRILIAKTLMGIALCVGPMAVAAIVSVLAAGGRELSAVAMLDLYACSTLTMLSLFVWMLALTARLPNEARAGLLALGILIFWLLATEGLTYPSLPSALFSVSPIAFVYRSTPKFEAPPPPFLLIVVVQLAIAAALLGWASN